jgi:virulence factor Mce-like protein
MRRIVAIALLVVGLPAVLALSLGASSPTGSDYVVRAVFDNASFLNPGEDVKVAGVKVGQVQRLDVTKDKKAAVILDIANTGFAPFHADGHCTIRPQSLIGERYVECTPGTSAAPELPTIPKGLPGSGQRLLTLDHTSSPVDIDLVGNVMRLPFRQRLAIIINEFGTALAGNSSALNQAIHRANPALRQTDEVLNILASQNRTLAELAHNSDVVLTPLAGQRKRLAHFVVAANATGQATAERSADIERSFQRLPVFLRELQPTLKALGNVSEQMTPVLTDLHTAAPDLNRFVSLQAPFAHVATPAVVSLGKATVIARPALVKSEPLVRELAKFAKNAGPVGKYLAQITTSLDQTGGIERAMDYLFFQMLAVNGFDGISHYLRAGLITNLCSTYSTTPTAGCNSNFTTTKSIASGSAAGNKNDRELAATRGALSADQAPQPKGGDSGGSPAPTNPFAALQSLTDPKTTAERRRGLRNATGNGSTVSPAFGKQTARDQALDYLLGNDGR